MCCGVTGGNPAPPPLPPTPLVAVPNNAPVTTGTVWLRYLGSAPTIDLANVPSGARYRLRTDSTILVYPIDLTILLSRLKPDNSPLFERLN